MSHLEGVRKAFGSQVVLKDVDFDVKEGETVALLGPSGTGKSVTLKTIIGLIRPDAGTVLVDDQNVWQLDRLGLKRASNVTLNAWWKQAFEYRSGGFDRLLGAVPGCPNIESLTREDVRGSLFVHELTEVRPGTALEYLAAVREERAPLLAEYGHQLVGLYEVLLRIEPSPVVELNRAAAVAMRHGPAAGLALVDAILARGDLRQYYLAHSARADLCRRLGQTDEARASYRRALELTRQEPERRFLERRLRELGGEPVSRG
jgi:energy-coupling factor transporter ATP-binding protein EcfA2